MFKTLLVAVALLMSWVNPSFANPGKNIRDFNVSPKNDGKTNTRNLQKQSTGPVNMVRPSG